jgi:hypothetical protein
MVVNCKIGEIGLALEAKQFSTGSVGFHGNTTVMVNDVPHYANILLIEEGSSPNSKGEKRAAYLLRKKEREPKPATEPTTEIA